MTRIKICGLTREEDVRVAADLGAAYLGFHFASGSPRRVTLEKARSLARCARGALRVGVFVGESREEIEAASEAASLDLAQLHREAREEDLSLPVPIIAVVQVTPSGARRPAAEILTRCHALLFDSDDGTRAGPRAPFDWSALVADRSAVPVWLAGGLTPENVAEAVRKVRPAGVDVASGVE
ncbi:MAG: N-(5'-phosphoribosyl)anthranilate isomerase, partial [Thermoanaerobaculia bacterium]